jgi:hypothetical protein
VATFRLTSRVTVIAVLVMVVALGTLFVAQPRSASAHHEPPVCQNGLVLTPGSEEKDAIENAGDEKCYSLSGMEAGKRYTLVTEKVYVNHIHEVYFGGGGIVTGDHSAIDDSVLSVHDFTHYRCTWGPCPPENKLMTTNHAPSGDPSSQIELLPSGDEEIFAIVSGYGGATGGFKITLSQGVFRMADTTCGGLGNCPTTVVDIDPCALGGCVGILSGTVDLGSSGDAGESESASAVFDAVASDGAGVSADATNQDTLDTVAATNSAGVDDSTPPIGVAAATESADAAGNVAATESAATAGSASATGNVADTESADPVHSAVASDEPDQPNNTHRSDSTSRLDQPSPSSGDASEEIALAGGQGGLSQAGLVIAGLAVVLSAGMAGIFAVWKMRWSGR